MKKRMQRFVAEYETILTMKQSHNQAINHRQFVVESMGIVFLLIGVILIVGYLTGLRYNEIYVYTATYTMALFAYGFLQYLYDVRYKIVNQLEYRSVYYVIPKIGHVIIVMTLAAGLQWLWSLFVGIYNSETQSLLMIVLIGSTIPIASFLYHVEEKQKTQYGVRTKDILTPTALYFIVFYGMWSMIGYTTEMVPFVLVVALSWSLMLWKEMGLSKHLSRDVFWIALILGASASIVFRFNTIQPQDPIQLVHNSLGPTMDGTIIGVTTTEERIAVISSLIHSTQVTILDKSFEHITTSQEFEGFVSMYELDDRWFLIERQPRSSTNRYRLFEYVNETFVLRKTIELSDRISIGVFFPYQDGYLLPVTGWELDYEMALYYITSGGLQDVTSDIVELHLEYDEVILHKSESEYGLYSSNPNVPYIGILSDQRIIRGYYDDRVVVYDPDIEEYRLEGYQSTIEPIVLDVLQDDPMRLYGMSLYGCEIRDHYLILYGYARSDVEPHDSQGIVVIDISTGEVLHDYFDADIKFFVDEEIYVVRENAIYVIEHEQDIVLSSTASASLLLVGMILLIPTPSHLFVMEGGKRHA